MQVDTISQIEALKTTGTAKLLAQYREFFDDKAAPGNRIFLIRQLAHRIQEQVVGRSGTGELGFPAGGRVRLWRRT